MAESGASRDAMGTKQPRGRDEDDWLTEKKRMT